MTENTTSLLCVDTRRSSRQIATDWNLASGRTLHPTDRLAIYTLMRSAIRSARALIVREGFTPSGLGIIAPSAT